jgi:hypothetical protein
MVKSPQINARVLKSSDGSFGLSLRLENGEERCIYDITRDGSRIYDLCDAINRLGISSLHIDDVIEDFIG